MAKEMHKKFDKLFKWFEDNEFKNEGVYCRTTNLVFEFMEWLENAEDKFIAEELGLEFNEKTQQWEGLTDAKASMMKGCELWLR